MRIPIAIEHPRLIALHPNFGKHRQAMGVEFPKPAPVTEKVNLAATPDP
jgi:hypothetical protein